MAWPPNPWSATFLIAAVLPLVLSVVVFGVRPAGLQNRRLALLLLLEAALFVTAGATWLAETPAVAYGIRVLNQTISWVWLLAYVLFLATIRSPLSRPLRSRYVPTAILAVALVAAGSVLIWPDAYLRGIGRNVIGAYDMTIGPANALLVVLLVGAFVYGLLVAYSAWRGTPSGTMERTRAGTYLAAFGARDVLWLLSAMWYDGTSPLTKQALTVQVVLQAGSVVLFSGLLAYGILRTQLFDIDLKIKWTINRGTLVGMFLAVFFIVGVIAENWLTERYGLAFGGVAAGLLLFALNPLQRLADRVSDVAMPHVRDDEEYRTVRKQAVYQAAFESALLDGAVSERERDVLATLADELGLSAGDARRIERQSSVPVSG